jgi:alkanesulfonate monooxygenase SsuD/methylene tetrahydromethanopterin reductase-like flavin-dependent oxidoreductase (luciferase family)
MQFFGENAFKFGVFGLNCAGGMTPSRAPERWRAHWNEIVEVARLADAAGVEFLLPIAKWHGLGGQADMWGRSFETFTQAAALGMVTKHIGMFVTAHVSLITPAFAAKALATVDHATNGRAGLNIVCGWNPDEFKPHGIKLDGEHRYDRGLEWSQVFGKLLDGGPKFDWKSEYFDLEGLATDPLPLARPPIMSAAQSGDGQAFAARIADILFTSLQDIDVTSRTVSHLRAMAAPYGRKPDVYVQTQFVCKPTRREAEDYVHYYAVEMADPDAIDYFARQRSITMSKSTKSGGTEADRELAATLSGSRKRRFPGMFAGMYPVIGTPDDVVAELQKIAAAGVSGSTLVFLNYLQELPYFIQEVLPRMERAGLRRTFAATA